MSSMLEHFNRESAWSYYPEGDMRCSRCWQGRGGLVVSSGSNTVQCVDCSLHAMAVMMRKQIFGQRTFQKLLDLVSDETPLTSRIGAVIQDDLLLEQVKAFPKAQQYQFCRKAALQLGYDSAHPLGKFLRLYTMVMVLGGASCFPEAVLQLAGEPCSSALMRCNLAVALGYLSPEAPETQEYIASALAEHPQELQQRFVPIDGRMYPSVHKQYYLNTLFQQLNHWAATDQPLGTAIRGIVEYLLNALYGAKPLGDIYSATLRTMHKAGEIPGGSSIAAASSKLKKQQCVELFASVLCDPDAVCRWYLGLPVWVRVPLNQMLWEHRTISLQELLKHQEVPQRYRNVRSRGYVSENSIPPAAQMFLSRNDRYSLVFGSDLELYLHPEIAKLIRRGISTPDRCGFDAGRESFSPEYYEAENQGVLTQLPYAAAYIRHTGVKRAKNGERILKSTLKQVQEYASVPEPYRDDPDVGYLRTGVLIELLDQFISDTEEYTGPPETVLQHLYDYCFSIRRFEKTHLADALEHLTIDWKYPDVLEYKERTLAEKLLSQLPESRWVHVDEVYRVLAASDLLPQLQDFSGKRGGVSCSCVDITSWNGRAEQMTISEQTKRELFYLPYVRLLLFVLNTLGAVNLAVKDPVHPQYRKRNKLWLTPFDGIMEVSLTPLGSRLSGRKEQSRQPEAQTPRLHLDHRQLIVTVESSDPMAELMLQQLACRIGPSSYLVQSREFLNGCSSVEDVQDRVRQFCRCIHDELPENWKEFFSRAVQQAKPVEPVKTEYLIFRIDPEQTELINILFQDDQIRRHLKKAEDYHVLIASAGYAQVRKRLLEYGYLLPEKQHLNQG